MKGSGGVGSSKAKTSPNRPKYSLLGLTRKAYLGSFWGYKKPPTAHLPGGLECSEVCLVSSSCRRRLLLKALTLRPSLQVATGAQRSPKQHATMPQHNEESKQNSTELRAAGLPGRVFRRSCRFWYDMSHMLTTAAMSRSFTHVSVPFRAQVVGSPQSLTGAWADLACKALCSNFVDSVQLGPAQVQ